MRCSVQYVHVLYKFTNSQAVSHRLIFNFFPFIYQHFLDSFWQWFILSLREPEPEEPGDETEGTKNGKLQAMRVLTEHHDERRHYRTHSTNSGDNSYG